MRAPRLSIGLGSFLVALALVVAVGVGSAIAVIPNQGTYYACLVKKTGAIKVINYPKVTCARGQTLLKWNAKGPAGPAGAQGVQGPKGDPGPADWNVIPNVPAGLADGVDNEGVTAVKLTRVVGPQEDVTVGSLGTPEALCPVGSRVTGGGFLSTSSTGDFGVAESRPTDDLSGWEVDGTNNGGSLLKVRAYAVCMSVEPAGAITTAKKGLLPASVKKAMRKQGR